MKYNVILWINDEITSIYNMINTLFINIATLQLYAQLYKQSYSIK